MSHTTQEQTLYYDYDKRYNPSAMEFAHFHNVHELYFLENGKTTHFMGDKVYLMNSGDMLFIPKGVFHKTDNKDTKFVERHLFMFDDSDFDDEEILGYIEELKHTNYIQISPEHRSHITDIARKMSYESAHQYRDSEKMQKLYLQQLLILISRFRVRDALPKTNALHHIVQEMITYISTNVSADLSLPTLAKMYNVSPSHLSKQFRNLTGIALSEYINIARVTAAETLLLNTNMPITQIALECGFNDSNYFARVFKKLRGITPKKYSLQH